MCKGGIVMKKVVDILIQNEYTFIAIKDNFEYHSKLNGIAPIMNKMLEDELYFQGCNVADKVIGKSAAMLLIKSQVKHIHAVVLSEHAKDILDNYKVSYSYDKIVPYIINRTHTGMCPMEKSVLEINDLNQAFVTLQDTLEKLKKK